MTHTMKKHEITNLAEVLEAQLAQVETMWDLKSKSHAYMVGYLMGIVKEAVKELKEKGGKA